MKAVLGMSWHSYCWGANNPQMQPICPNPAPPAPAAALPAPPTPSAPPPPPAPYALPPRRPQPLPLGKGSQVLPSSAIGDGRGRWTVDEVIATESKVSTLAVRIATESRFNEAVYTTWGQRPSWTTKSQAFAFEEEAL